MLTKSSSHISTPEAPASVTDVLSAANINARTGLATDYLNHFNEFVMLLELVPSLPDVRDDMLSWVPVTYKQHFMQSGFRERELAIQAYDLAPPRYRQAFDETISVLNSLVRTVQLNLQDEAGPQDDIQILAAQIRSLIARAGAIVNGGISFTTTSEAAQDAIDILFD